MSDRGVVHVVAVVLSTITV